MYRVSSDMSSLYVCGWMCDADTGLDMDRGVLTGTDLRPMAMGLWK